MGNVIEKIFAVLERIVSASPEPVLPSPLAEELNLNRATCSRLLKQLLDQGYILKVSRQQGYIPGPKLLTLSNIADFQKNLLDMARPVIDRCSEELHCSMLIAQLYNRKRYVLYHRNRDPELHIRITKPCYDDIFCTATGLVLIAHCTPEEQITCLREQKTLGVEILPDYITEKKMSRNLNAIAEQGYFECGKELQWIYAFPVYGNGKFCAALGASISRKRHTAAYHRKICKVLKLASEEISHGLVPHYTIA